MNEIIILVSGLFFMYYIDIKYVLMIMVFVYILNDYTNINIHKICDNPILLLTLFINSTEIHLMENSIALFLYYLHVKLIILFYILCRRINLCSNQFLRQRL